MKNLEIICLNIFQVFHDIQNLSDNEIFSVLMSCNNSDYEFTKAVCNFVNLSFEIRSDNLKECKPDFIIPFCVFHMLLAHSLLFHSILYLDDT